MNFLNGKLEKYYGKKLTDASQKLKSHQKRKKQLEIDLKQSNDELKIEIQEEIDRENTLIEIWKNNIVKINEHLEKL